LPPKHELPPTIPITFKRLCTGNSYFQSVLVELELADGGVLDSVHKTILETNMEVLKNRGASESDVNARYFPYYPHLSLHYGDVSAEKREEIVDDLDQQGVIESVEGHPPVTVVGVEGGFQVTEIWIVKTEGPIEEWQVLEKVELMGDGMRQAI